jgi:hypothetical protein
MKAEVERQWRTFPDAPGTHLSWRRVKGRAWELVSHRGSVWATLRLKGGGFGSGSERCSIEVKGRTFEMTRGAWGGGTTDYGRRDLVNSAGDAVLRRSSMHFDRIDDARVWLLDHGTFTFPVTGPYPFALMSAVDESGNTVIRYRLRAARFARIATNWGYGRMKVEIVINPQALSIPMIELLAAVTSEFLPAYFRFESRGGG